MEISDDEMDLVLSVLAHETRRSVVRALANSGTMTFSEMMQATGSKETGTFGFHFKKILLLLKKESDGRYSLSKLGLVAANILDGLGSAATVFAESLQVHDIAQPVELRDEVTWIRNLKVAWLNREKLQKSKGTVVYQCINVLIDQDVDEQTAKDRILSLSQIRGIDVPKNLFQTILSRAESQIADIVAYEGKISIEEYYDKVVKELEGSQELEFHTEGLLSAKDMLKSTRICNYGELKIMDDVTPELVQNNVLEIENHGNINAPKGLKEVLLSKMIENYGYVEEQ